MDVRLYTGLIDYDYLDLFEMELAEGRGFSREFGDERNSVLLNESAVKALGWEDPIGKQIFKWGQDTATVVGVLKDFHHNSLHLSIAPMQIFFSEASRQLAVKVSGKHLPETIAAIETAQKQFAPNFPVEYQFFEESFAQAYENEIKTGKMARWFTLLIIVIACLGLYGLSAFTTEMRTKEVGIRKILGASVGSLLLLLSRNFLSLVLLAFLIAIPVAYYLMSQWLQNFAYHVDMGLSIFLWTLVAMLSVTLLTVGYKTLKAATNKPVDALQEK
jgi:putative ABC transport system permease protein